MMPAPSTPWPRRRRLPSQHPGSRPASSVTRVAEEHDAALFALLADVGDLLDDRPRPRPTAGSASPPSCCSPSAPCCSAPADQRMATRAIVDPAYGRAARPVAAAGRPTPWPSPGGRPGRAGRSACLSASAHGLVERLVIDHVGRRRGQLGAGRHDGRAGVLPRRWRGSRASVHWHAVAGGPGGRRGRGRWNAIGRMWAALVVVERAPRVPLAGRAGRRPGRPPDAWAGWPA